MILGFSIFFLPDSYHGVCSTMPTAVNTRKSERKTKGKERERQYRKGFKKKMM
jgi:hypothetical protein